MNNSFGKVKLLGRRFDEEFLAGNGYTFRAKVEYHKSKGALDGFVKFFNPRTQKFGPANELLAHHVGQKLHVPVAATFPCYCESAQLIGRLPWIPKRDPDAAHLCIASLSVAGFEYRVRRVSIPEFISRLLRWPHAPAAAIFDELIFNTDRHQNNFLVIDERDMVLIDHERSFCGVDWDRNMLKRSDRTPSPGNYLARLIMDSGSEITKRRLAELSRDMIYGPQFMLTDFPDYLYDIAAVLNISEDDIQAIVGFLNARRRNLPNLIRAQQQIEQRLAVRTS